MSLLGLPVSKESPKQRCQVFPGPQILSPGCTSAYQFPGESCVRFLFSFLFSFFLLSFFFFEVTLVDNIM